DIPDIDSRRRFPIGTADKLTELIVSDEEADITYSFHEISRQLIWYVIKDFDVRKRVFSSIPPLLFERRSETLAEKDIFSLIKMITRLPLAVYI
uniref:hypothetical protein n=1 Tax=Escherichia coli TaxID=562 RepID=UPI0022853AC7